MSSGDSTRGRIRVSSSGYGAGHLLRPPEVGEFLFEHTHNSHAHLKRTQRMASEIVAGDEKQMRPLVASPDDIFVVAAGGRAGAFSCYIPGWGSAKNPRKP